MVGNWLNCKNCQFWFYVDLSAGGQTPSKDVVGSDCSSGDTEKVYKKESLKQMYVCVPVRWMHFEEHWGHIFYWVGHPCDPGHYWLLPFPRTNPALCNKNRLLYNTQWHLCLIDECLCYVRLPASCNSLGYNLGPTHICLTNITYISQSRKPVSN